MSVRDRLIVALDVSHIGAAEAIIGDLVGLTGPFKIGLEAINAGIGHQLAEMVTSAGGKVFWDGKFKDIPHTVEGAVKGLLKRIPSGIWAFNLYADGGKAMMEAAVKNRGDSMVLAVTVLTSLDDDDSLRIYRANVFETVNNLAKLASEAGVHGLISSPREAAELRSNPNLSRLQLITPAIRPDWAVPADQKRPTTPKQAVQNGADYIVVGRPITDPPKESGHTRRTAAEAILEEMETALEGSRVS